MNEKLAGLYTFLFLVVCVSPYFLHAYLLRRERKRVHRDSVMEDRS